MDCLRFLVRILAVSWIWVWSNASTISQQAVSGKLEVFIIAHSHCDMGYRESIDGYYNDKVESILNTITYALTADPTKTFVWEEVGFFQMWWPKQNSSTKSIIQNLAQSGRLEFIGGGWAMSDDADVEGFAAIDNLALGLEYLDQLGLPRPRFEWHIDPFGHSIWSPSLYGPMGYSAMVLNRVDDAIKQQWKTNKHLQFLWVNEPQNNISTPSSLLAHVLDSHYSTPYYSSSSADSIETKASNLTKICRQRAEWYRADSEGNVYLLIPFGGDFSFTSPSNFDDMDQIIKYVNTYNTPDQNSSFYNPTFTNVTMHYSTLADFFTTINSRNISFPVYKNNDFLPYVACSPCDAAQCQHVPCGTADAYWSGYFTSKPSQKLEARHEEYKLHHVDTFYALRQLLTRSSSSSSTNILRVGANAGDPMWDNMTYARQQYAIMTHHDAITGTSFPPAYDDYDSRLGRTETELEMILQSLKSQIIAFPLNSAVPALTNLTNLPFPLLTINTTVPLIISNPLGWSRNEYLRIPLPSNLPYSVNNLYVIDANGNTVASQVVTTTSTLSALYFTVTLPPLGINTYFVALKSMDKFFFSDDTYQNKAVNSISNGLIRLNFNTTTGRPESLDHLYTNGSLCWSTIFQQDFYYYNERLPNNSDIFMGSNVYTFVPSGPPVNLYSTTTSLIQTANGPLVWEVIQKINDYINQTFQIFLPIKSTSEKYEKKNNKELDESGIGCGWDLSSEFTAGKILSQSIVGPLPSLTSGSVNVRYSFGIATPQSAILYTDDHAQRVIPRYLNLSKTIQANLYPSVSYSYLNSSSSSWTAVGLMATRSMGVTHYNGGLEVMLHRRINDPSDVRGNDTITINDTQLLWVWGSNSQASISNEAWRRRLSLHHQNPLSPHYPLKPVASAKDWLAQYQATWKPLLKDFPTDLHVATFRALSNATQSAIGIRLQNLESSFNGDTSNVISVDLDTIFISGPLQSYIDMALDLTVQSNDPRLKQFVWKVDSDVTQSSLNSGGSNLDHTMNVAPDSIEAALINILI